MPIRSAEHCERPATTAQVRPGPSRFGLVLRGTVLLLAAVLGSAGDAAGQARTVLNGGFEVPVITQNWIGLPDTNVPGWTSPDGVIEIWQSGFNGVPSVSGGQFAEANANSPSGFAQSVCLLAGEVVPWNFWHRGRSTVDSMRVTMNGVEIMRVGTGPGAWVQYSNTFTVSTSGPHEVRFSPLNTGSLGNFVDDLYFQLIPHIDFGPDASSAETGAGGPMLMVSGTLTSAETIDLTVTGGSASAGTDFSGVTTVTIPAGVYDGTAATAIFADIGLIDDGVSEGPETVDFSMSNPSAGIRLAHADAAACGGAVRTTATFTILDDEQSDIAVVKAGPATAQVGTTVAYGIVTTNVGPAPALLVVLTDTLPVGATFVSATRGATVSGRVVTWPAIAGAMAVGASVTDSVRFAFTTSGTFSQVAAHRFPGNDPTAANNKSVISVAVCGPPTVTVSTVAALRAAVADTCVSLILLNPGTYNLGPAGELAITHNKILRNVGGGEAILDGAGTTRVANISVGAVVEMDGLTVQNGSSGADGGGIYLSGSLTIRNGTITGNSSGDDGGGLYMNTAASLVMENVTVSGNTASDQGGGLHVRNNSTLTHVTVASNTGAAGRTGGVYARDGGATLTNTIVADNVGGEARTAGITFVSANLVEACSGCPGSVLRSDPGLQPLALNGTDTRSQALGAGSLAIDAATGGLPTDQHGTGRPAGSGYDLGAYESPPPSGINVTPDGLASPVQRATGTAYSQPFLISNTGATAEVVDFLLSVGAGGASPFVSLDSITGTGVAGIADSVRTPAVPAGGSTTVTAWYSAGSSILGTVDTLGALVRTVSNPALTDPGRAEVAYICGSPTITVGTMAQLRAAVADACINTIGVTPGNYSLTAIGSGALVVARDLTVFNTGGGEVVIDAGGASRVWEINSGSVDFTGLTISGGFNNADGGGILNSGNLTIRSGTITNNATNDDGGGIFSGPGSTLRLENATVSGNTSGDRGAGLDLQGTAELIHVTVAANAASGPAGGINVRGGGTTTIRNTLVADNSQGSGTQLVVAGTLVSNGANVVEGGCSACLGSDLTGDPGLLPLAMNGGNSRTHELSGSSIAIDVGSPPDGLGSDQRGIARPLGAGYDIGAYEAPGPASVAVTPDGGAMDRLPGSTASYVETYTVQNAGIAPAAYELEAHPLGAALTVDSIRGVGLTYDVRPDSALTGGIAQGASIPVQVYYTVGIVAAGTVNQLVLRATDASIATVSDSGYVAVTVVRPSLTLSKGAAVSGAPAPGIEVTYDVTVVNAGNEAAVAVIVLDSIPVETDFKLASPAQTLPIGVTAVIEYATAPGGWGYAPASLGCGASAGLDRCVRYIRWVLQAPLPSSAPDNQGLFTFVTVIR